MRLIYITFVVGSLLSAALRYKTHLLENQALNEERRSEISNDSKSVLTYSKLESKLQLADTVAVAAFSHPRSNTHFARILRDIAALVPDEKNRLDYYCAALSELGKAVQKDPLNSRYLINWANLRQLLSQIECKGPYTKGNYKQVADFAVEQNPSEPSVAYAAGLINLWSGVRVDALKNFSKVLYYNTDLTEGQRKLIVSEIRSASDLEQVLPARFPQVYNITKALKASAGPLYFELEQQLSEKQIAAIKDSALKYQYGKLPLDLHMKRLVSLMGTMPSDRVRLVLDFELASLNRRIGKSELGAYLEARAKLKNVPIVRTTISYDTSAAKTALGEWGKNELLYFDEPRRTLGFYVSKTNRPKIIELKSMLRIKKGVDNNIKIFVSDNNQFWQEYPNSYAVKTYELGQVSILALQLDSDSNVKGNNFNYWKINFTSNSKILSVHNRLDDLLNVYGEVFAEKSPVK